MGKGSHAVPHRSFLQSKSLLKVVLGHARRRPLLTFIIPLTCVTVDVGEKRILPCSATLMYILASNRHK